MAMLSTGLQTLRYAEILDNVKQNLYTELSPKIDLSEDSAIGILLSTVCREIASAYEAISEVYDSGVITKAEGTSLDELCMLNGIYRNLAKATTGFLEVTGDIGTTMLQDSRIRATSGDIYNPRDDYTLTPIQCIGTAVYVNSLHVGQSYTLSIDNVNFQHVVTETDTEETILNSLATQISDGNEMQAVVRTDHEFALQPTMFIDRDKGNINKRTQVAQVTATTYLTFTKVTTLILIDAEETGALVAQGGVVNSMETTIAGIDSVYNRYDLTIGRDAESDTELRQRYLDNLVVTGIATSDSILQAVRRVEGVKTASIQENDEEVTDSNGIPPKSFKITVVGGANKDVAQAIWDTKPVGIKSFGDQVGTAHDSDGGEQHISFFRPQPQYAFVKLEWDIEDEEKLNFLEADVPDEIKRAIGNYGATMEVGNDIIPNRIIRYVYEHVQGIVVDSISVGISNDQDTEPATYGTVRIPIANTEYTVWETKQYTVTKHVTP